MLFSSLFGLLFSKNQERSINVDTCVIRLAKKYSKTVQKKVREYKIVVLPEPELGNLKYKV